MLKYVVYNMPQIEAVVRSYEIGRKESPSLVVTIPKFMRERLGLRAGDLFSVSAEAGRVIFEPTGPREEAPG